MRIIKDHEFQREVLDSNKPVVVSFGESGLKDRKFNQFLNEMHECYSDKCHFIKMSLTENSYFINKYDVKEEKLIVFVDGEVDKTISPKQSETDIIREIKEYIRVY